MELILGSSSDRRREILSYFTVRFRQVSPPFDESIVRYFGDPIAYVTTLALEKAHSLKSQFPSDIILTADTIVTIDSKILGKPKDRSHALEMLTALSGRWHTVYTGVAVIGPHITLSETESTHVHINELQPYELEHYLDGIVTHDKAGSYAVQHAGCLIVKEIKGCYYNAMGLPINTTNRLLQKAGINLWDHLR